MRRKKSQRGVNEEEKESIRRKESQRGVNQEENKSKYRSFRPLKIVT